MQVTAIITPACLSHPRAHTLGRHQGQGRMSLGWVRCGLGLPVRRLPQGPWGPGNRNSCAHVPVLLRRGAFPDRKVTICAPSPSPGPHPTSAQQFHRPSSTPGKGTEPFRPSWPVSPVPLPPNSLQCELLLPRRTKATPSPTASPQVHSIALYFIYCHQSMSLITRDCFSCRQDASGH